MLERLFPQQSDDKLYVEDVMSVFLYTGNGSTQTITNGIDLAGKGGLVWIKNRNVPGGTFTQNHFLFDTLRGSDYRLSTNTTSPQDNSLGSQYLTSFDANGFSLDGRIGVNGSGVTYASWTFRKAPKFFDVVTYTGNGVAGRQIAHNLGVAPGMIIIKKTSGADDWVVYHRSISGQYLILNSTAAAATLNVITANATTFTLPTPYGFVNGDSSNTYVAYLFAHDATADGIIQCGSFGGGGLLRTVTLGWEPQWVLTKPADVGGSDWRIFDTMRGMPVVSGGGQARTLRPNTSGAEGVYGNDFLPTATGFQAQTSDGSNDTIYVAIRRGPMRTPTLGTSVFSADFFGGGTVYYNSGFPTDLALKYVRAGDSYNTSFADRLRGGNNTLVSSNYNAELADSANYFDNMVGYGPAYTGGTNSSTISWLFRRAPGFFDQVCYTGTGSVVLALNHNLGAVPQLIIVRRRNPGSSFWPVYYGDVAKYLSLEDTNAATVTDFWNNTAPTITQFTVNGGATFGQMVNASGSTYVAYLFASVPGVSKVGTYTGNGSSQTINCGFTNGARFFFVKRIDTSGNWYAWDTTRGIVSGDDPVARINSTAGEYTIYDSVDADSTGIIVNQDSTININVGGATYIFLAIA